MLCSAPFFPRPGDVNAWTGQLLAALVHKFAVDKDPKTLEVAASIIAQVRHCLCLVVPLRSWLKDRAFPCGPRAVQLLDLRLFRGRVCLRPALLGGPGGAGHPVAGMEGVLHAERPEPRGS